MIAVLWQLEHQAFWCVMGTMLAVWLAWWFVGIIISRRFGGRPWLAWHAFGLCFGLYTGMGIFLAGTNHPGAHWLREAGAACILSGAWLLSAVVDRFFWRNFLQKHRVAAPTLLRQLSAVVIALVAVAVVMTNVYGVQIPGLLTTSGVAALVVGLAMQDLLGNLIAGFSIHFTRAYKAGDWLVIDGRHCEVMEIHWRATRFRTNDNIWLEIPNNQLVKERITSLTFPEKHHAMRMEIGADYDVPPAKVKAALLRAARATPGVIDKPESKVFLKNFGESSIVYEIKFWMADQELYNDICDGIRTNAWYEFRREGIRIPFPIRTLETRRPAPAAVRDQRGKIRERMRAQELFAGLSDEEVAGLAENCRTLLYGAGETVLRQGEEGDSMFLVVEGAAEVRVMREGTSRLVAEVRAGDCFGEMSLLTGEGRTASVVAKEDLLVAEVDKELLAPILAGRPELVEAVSDLLARRREALAEAGAISANETKNAPSVKQLRTTLMGRIRKFFEGAG